MAVEEAGSIRLEVPWRNAPLIAFGTDPWNFFGLPPEQLDCIVPFNETDGAISANDKEAIVEAIANGGNIIYFQRPGQKYFAAILHPAGSSRT